MNAPTSRKRRITLMSAAVVSLVFMACTQANPVATASERFQVGALAIAAPALVQLPAGEYSRVIDEHGGRLNFGVGEILFPPGALDKETKISAATDGRTMAVTLRPEGLHFPLHAQPILRFNIVAHRDPVILYVDHTNTVLELLKARPGERTGVEAQLQHFSKYIFGVE